MSTAPAVVVLLTGNNHSARNALAQQLADIVRAHFPNGQLQMHLHNDLAQAVGL
jgi:hypothetical protein